MTDIKSILVHVDSSAACTARLHVAQRLAEQFDAVVTAAYAATPSPIDYPTGFSPSADIATLMLELDRDRLARAKALFDRAVSAGMPRLNWVELPGEPVQAFGRAALYADLVVAGQHAPHDKVQDVPADFIESVLIDSGTPMLVVPYIGAPATIGRTVLVAWKEARESARALSAALPLLQAADHVHVAMWHPVDDAADEVAARIQARLRIHGVPVSVHGYGAESRDVGEHLLSLAADRNSDLLVMGGYGHSRAREWVLGGATRTVLRTMTLPVLMAH